jgi:hypothetical protein
MEGLEEEKEEDFFLTNEDKIILQKFKELDNYD